MIKNWTKIFLYNIKRDKFLTALNITGLSIGIVGVIFALLYSNDEQSYNSWNSEKDNVYQVLVKLGDMPFTAGNSLLLKTALDKDPNVKKAVYIDSWYQKGKIIYKGKKELTDKIINTQKDFFTLFPFTIIQGNAVSALNDDTTIAISDNLAEKLFGNEDPIGKQVSFYGSMLVVRAVFHIPGNSSLRPDIVVNRMKNLVSSGENNGAFAFKLLLLMKDPSKVEETRKMLEKAYFDEFTVRIAKENGFTLEEMTQKMGRFTVVMESLSQTRLHSVADGFPEGRGNYQFLLISVGLSVLILVLSIVNYVNMATANAIKRAKEVGVRKVLGASKDNIKTQFICETILTTLFSIVLALIIVELTLPYYNNFLGKNLTLVGSQFYFQLILIFIVTVLLAGLFPAVYVSNFDTLKVLKGNYERSKNGVWLRNSMLIFQFAVAAFFIIGSNIVYDQVKFLSNKDLGFKGDQIIAIPLNFPGSDYQVKNPGQNIYNKYATLKQELAKINGVESVSTGLVSFDGSDNFLYGVLYKDVLFKEKHIGIDFGLLEMMKIKVVKGRNLDKKLASDTINSVMLNESAVKLMSMREPIGDEVVIRDQKLKVVGVVKDFNLLSPEVEVQPMAFFHVKTLNMADGINLVYVKLKTDQMDKTLAAIENFWGNKVDKEYPFKYDFVDKQYARTYESYVKQKNLFSVLNIVVILIAFFGLFALASYSIQRRMKEIAIRKTLGAETNTLLKELSKQYILYCIIGFLIALFPVCYFLNKWLENFAFRIDISVFPFLFGFVILLILTMIIVLLRAYRATKSDVLKYLKYE